MDQDLGRLTEREKQVLRLLVRGHDAKSIARELRLSVHTINERLRDARGKLGVSSSREAARSLAAHEEGGAEKLGDKAFGVAPPIRQGAGGGGRRLLWLTGGMFVMAVITAVLALALAAGRMQPARTDPAQDGAGLAATRASDPAALQAARDWLGLIDHHAWEASWRASAADFRARTTPAAWAAMAQRVDESYGAPTSRRLRSDTATDRLPGAPPGQYEVIRFDTDFARKAGMVETVALIHEDGSWRVSGYFIRGAEFG